MRYKAMKKIEILGIGCVRCAEITERAKKAVKDLALTLRSSRCRTLRPSVNMECSLCRPWLWMEWSKIAGNVPEVEEIKEMD